MPEAIPIPDEATKTPPRARPRPAAKPSLYDYPASDGKPMGETPWHMRAMLEAVGMLTEFFRDRPDVYVGGNMMMELRLEGERLRLYDPARGEYLLTHKEERRAREREAREHRSKEAVLRAEIEALRRRLRETGK